MLKKMSRFLIVAVIQPAILVLVLFLLAPYLLEFMNGAMVMAKTLDKTRVLSFMLRALVYVAIFFAWPHLTKKIIQAPSTEVLKQVNKVRFILIGASLSVEALYWVGKL